MLNLNKKTLNKLYIQKKLSDQKIADKFKMSRRNVTRLRKIYNINSLEDYQRFPSVELTNRLCNVLVGSLLGDACARKRGNGYSQIIFEQSIKHKEYFYWLKEEFKDWIFNKNKKISTNKKFSKITKTYNYSYAFQTVCHPIFDEFYNGFYNKKRKRVNFKLLKKYFNEISLAVWIMDDGGLTGKNPRTRLCTNGFKKNEVIGLNKFLMEKYNLKSWITKAKTKNKITYELHFDKDSSLKITDMIKNYIIPSMQYKLLKNNEKNNNDKEIISKTEWIKLNSTKTKEEIKKIISDKISKFPLPLKNISKNDLKKDFKSLINLNEKNLLVNSKWQPKYSYNIFLNPSYIKINKIGIKCSNYFQQYNRFSCDNIGFPSPKRTWENEKFRLTLLNSLWTMKQNKITISSLRMLIGISKYIASQFKPSVAKYIYNTYGNNGDVLDFSAGWGDRLAGFYASNCKSYTGIDPNKAVYDKYFEQEKFYKSIVPNKTCEFINLPSEDVDLGNKKFDLVFTSPPYFDLERYSDDENQSWKRYKKLDDWLNKFLFKTIENSWNHLKQGGYLIINLSDIYCHHKRQFLCDPMNDFISKLPNAKYEGAIGMKMSKRPNNKLDKNDIFCEPLWIWKKN